MESTKIKLTRGFHQGDSYVFLKTLSKVPDSVDVEIIDEAEHFPNGQMLLTVVGRLIQRQKLGKGNFKINIDDTAPPFKSLMWNVLRNVNGEHINVEFRDGQLIPFQSIEDVHRIVEELGEHILKQSTNLNNAGFFALKWVVNEILDNVINHSGTDFGGIFYAHYSAKDEKIRIGVVDFGIGVYNSLCSGTLTLKPKNDEDALRMCIEKGITRDKLNGQGNGLFGLFSIVVENNGTLRITSGRKSLGFRNHVFSVDNTWVVDRSYPTTTIYFELELSARLSLHRIFPKTYSDQEVDWSILSMENDNGSVSIKLVEKFLGGFGTRKSGQQMFNYIIKMIEFHRKPIEIDFEGISVVSSSWSDEFIGKLFVKLGPLTFGQLIRLKNLNDVIVPIMEHAIAQRIQVGLEDS